MKHAGWRPSQISFMKCYYSIIYQSLFGPMRFLAFFMLKEPSWMMSYHYSMAYLEFQWSKNDVQYKCWYHKIIIQLQTRLEINLYIHFKCISLIIKSCNGVLHNTIKLICFLNTDSLNFNCVTIFRRNLRHLAGCPTSFPNCMLWLFS